MFTERDSGLPPVHRSPILHRSCFACFALRFRWCHRYRYGFRLAALKLVGDACCCPLFFWSNPFARLPLLQPNPPALSPVSQTASTARDATARRGGGRGCRCLSKKTEGSHTRQATGITIRIWRHSDVAMSLKRRASRAGKSRRASSVRGENRTM